MSAVAMAKQPKGETEDEKGKEKGSRKTAPIQVDADLASMISSIAAHDKIRVADLISPLIKQWVRTNYERVQEEMARRIRQMKAEDRKD